MRTPPDVADRKSAAKKPAKKSAKKSSYDKLKANGWGGLLKTFDAGTINKLKAM